MFVITLVIYVCYGSIRDETSGQTSFALNFSHQLNPNLAIP